MTRRVVLLGTGTGVGKTYVGALLARSLREAGASVLGLKPIESGVPADRSHTLDSPTDAETLSTASDLDVGHFRAFAEPVSPHLAARQAGQTLEVSDVVDWVAQQERAHPERAVTLVETAGGALSPLDVATTNFDLARALDPAVFVLIGADALGVLHDVAATLLACRALGRVPDVVVLSGARPVDASTGTNARELEQIVFPRLGAAAPPVTQVETVSAGAPTCESFVSAVLRALGR